jgi:hypothetical protein
MHLFMHKPTFMKEKNAILGQDGGVGIETKEKGSPNKREMGPWRSCQGGHAMGPLSWP